MSSSVESLAADLATLGIEPGDVLFIHSSYKSLGPVDGGPGAVVSALEKAVGPAGTLMMPSFNLIEHARRASSWDVAATPSTVGYLTEYFRQLPGTVRSDHYSHSVAARGHEAQAYTAEHRSNDGMTSPWDLLPWGKTYGSQSPMLKAMAAGGKLLMLGVDDHCSTYLHVVECMLWAHRKKAEPDARYIWLDRVALGQYWDAHGRLRRGKVGQADSRLCDIADYVNTLLDVVMDDPERYRRRD